MRKIILIKKISVYLLALLFMIWMIKESVSIGTIVFSGIIISILLVNISESKRKIFKNKYLNFEDIEYLLDVFDYTIVNFSKNSPDLIFYKDKNLTYQACNATMYKTLKIRNNDIRNLTDDDIFPKETADLMRKYDKEILLNRSYVNYVVYFQDKNNTKRIFNIIGSPMMVNNNIIGIFTIARDITKIEEIKQECIMKRQQIDAIINNQPILTFLKDKNGNFIKGNNKCVELLCGSIYNPLSEKDIAQIYAMSYTDVIKMEDQTIINEKCHVNYSRKMKLFGNDEKWYQVYKTPIFDNNNEVTSIVVSVREIEAEKDAVNQRETYIATLTHDLKTPTIAQIRSLELILNGEFGELNEEQREIMELTLSSCKYMYDMISTILSTYKYEDGDIKLDPEEFNLVELTIETCKEVESYVKEKDLKIILNMQIDNPNIYGDRTQIKRVIINLLTNSISYAYENSEILINIKSGEDNTIEYFVNNKSYSIRPDALDRLFDKYVTHKSKYKKVGVGLGLYLSRQIIESHHGRMIAFSNKENSYTFGFKIKPNITADKFSKIS